MPDVTEKESLCEVVMGNEVNGRVCLFSQGSKGMETKREFGFI